MRSSARSTRLACFASPRPQRSAHPVVEYGSGRSSSSASRSLMRRRMSATTARHGRRYDDGARRALDPSPWLGQLAKVSVERFEASRLIVPQQLVEFRLRSLFFLPANRIRVRNRLGYEGGMRGRVSLFLFYRGGELGAAAAETAALTASPVGRLARGLHARRPSLSNARFTLYTTSATRWQLREEQSTCSPGVRSGRPSKPLRPSRRVRSPYAATASRVDQKRTQARPRYGPEAVRQRSKRRPCGRAEVLRHVGRRRLRLLQAGA
jgi:hypothetical protein